MRKLIITAFLLLPLFAVSAQTKYALVIGNNTYRNGIPQLNTPTKDTTAISAALREIGYTVDLKQNVDLRQMEDAVDTFMANLRKDKESEGFFWFAGHGVSTEGKKEHHLLPIDAEATDDRRIERTGYSVSDLLEQFESVKNKTNVIVLDACRSSLTVQGVRSIASRGLQVVSAQQVQGNKIVYSTAEGQTAADAAAGVAYSPFAQAFLNHIKDTAPFNDVFVDIRAETIRLTITRENPSGQKPITLGDFAVKSYSLNPRAATQGTAPLTPSPQPVPDGFVFIEGGTFTMGSPASEPDHESDETQHTVTVGSFYMGKYEVTQAEYQEVMGTNPSNWKGANLPVECVSWYDAIEYCNKRSERERLTPAYNIDKSRFDPNNYASTEYDTIRWVVSVNKNANGYRLPTEAEWEYACRAGTTTPFNMGNNITTNQANYDGNYPYNNNVKGTYREKTTTVGSFAPNRWGLYDMHGNVWEWCWDWYGNYSNGAQTDPVGAASGSHRVLRGGGWSYSAQSLRSALRSYDAPSNRGLSLGFRVVRP